MYAKLINGQFVAATKKIIHNNTLYNPAPEDVLVSEGWKLVVESPIPSCPELHHAESHWEENDSEIVRVYDVVEDSPMQIIEYYKAKLAETDYQAIKYSEGWISEEDYSTIKAQRQQWRDIINSYENNTENE